MSADTAAIRSAVTACALTLQRLGDQMQHLAALLGQGDGVDIDAAHRTGARQAHDLELKSEEVRRFPAAVVAELSAPARAKVIGPRGGDNRKPRHSYNGQPMFVHELAALAGCKVAAMQQRLRKGATPEQAVARGPMEKRGKKPKAAAPAAAPAPVRMTAPTPTPFNPDMTAAQKPPVLARDAEVIVPPNVKRTVAPTPPGRFDPRPGEAVPPVFSALGPGRYFEDRRGDA